MTSTQNTYLLRRISKWYIIFYAIFSLVSYTLPTVIYFFERKLPSLHYLAASTSSIILLILMYGFFLLVPAIALLLFVKEPQSVESLDNKEIEGAPKSLVSRVASRCLFFAGGIFIFGFLLTVGLYILTCFLSECGPVGLFFGLFVMPICLFLLALSGVLYLVDYILKKKG